MRAGWIAGRIINVLFFASLWLFFYTRFSSTVDKVLSFIFLALAAYAAVDTVFAASKGGPASCVDECRALSNACKDECRWECRKAGNDYEYRDCLEKCMSECVEEYADCMEDCVGCPAAGVPRRA